MQPNNECKNHIYIKCKNCGDTIYECVCKLSSDWKTKKLEVCDKCKDILEDKMHSHYIKKCKVCEKVVEQCRCMDKNKTTTLVVCEDCTDRVGTIGDAADTIKTMIDFRKKDDARENVKRYWKDTDKNHPKKGGSYWVYVDINDSSFQTVAGYNVFDNEWYFTNIATKGTIKYWTDLLDKPNIHNTKVP